MTNNRKLEFNRWCMLFQAHDGRWNVALPTFDSEQEAKEHIAYRSDYQVMRLVDAQLLAENEQVIKYRDEDLSILRTTLSVERKQLESAQARIAELEEKCLQYREGAENVSHKMGAINLQLEAKIAELEAEVEAANDVVKDLAKMMNDAIAESKTLKAEVESLNKQDSEELKAICDIHQEERERLLKMVNEKHEAFERCRFDSQMKESKIQALEAEKIGLLQLIDGQEESLSALKSEVEKLKRQIEHKVETINELNRVIAQDAKLYRQSESQVAGLRKCAESARNAIRTAYVVNWSEATRKHLVKVTEQDLTQALASLDNPKPDNRDEIIRRLKEKLTNGKNSPRELCALMAEGEGNDVEVYRKMAFSAMNQIDEAFIEVASE